MATLATIRTTIADQLNRSDLSSQITDELNKAITHYSAARFWFNEAQTTFSLVAGQQAYGTADSVPSTLTEIDFLKVTVSSTYYELKAKPFDWIEQENKTNLRGIPEYYAYYLSKIHLYPLPNSTYTATLSYSKSYADLSADADTNDFTTYAIDLITQRAKKNILKNYVHDFEMAMQTEKQEDEALNSLIIKTNRLKETRQIEPSQF